MSTKAQGPEKMSRRKFMKSAAAIGGGALLAACAPKVTGESTPVGATKAVAVASPSKAQVTIHFTHERPPAVFDPLAVELTKNQYPNINLKIDQTPFGNGWEDYINNVLVRIAGGEKLDVISIATEGLDVLSSKGTLIPLDPFLAADSAASADFASDMHPALMKMLQWKGKQMLIPFQWNSMVIHYNYVMFKDKGIPEPLPDWSWDDFLVTCEKLASVTGSSNDVYAYSFYDQTFHISPWFFNNNTSFLTSDWVDLNLQDPKVAETLQFLQDLIIKYKVCPNPAGWDDAGQFHARHLAMLECGGWCVGGHRGAGFKDYKMQYMPHKAGPLKTDVGTLGFGILASSEHPEEAWDAIKVLVSTPVQQNSLEIDGSPMSRLSIQKMDVWKNLAQPAPADMGIFWESLDHAALVPSPANFNTITTLLRGWYAQIWNGSISVADAIKGAQPQLQAEMDKLKG